jgi:transposase-like protein
MRAKSGSHRRRWSSEQRDQFLAAFHESKMTQRDFSNSHGVGLSTLNKWLRLERKIAPAKVKFKEVGLFKPVSSWPVEVVSPQGWIVRLQAGSAVEMLPELLQALPC